MESMVAGLVGEAGFDEAVAAGGALAVRYFAAARAAAGVEQDSVEVAGPLDRVGLTEVLVELHPVAPAGELPLARVLPQCSLLVDGVVLEDGEVVMPGTRVDVLPPFAGG